jgi:ubiquinone/menaquinone biosynthesis C-methylase UbiE
MTRVICLSTGRYFNAYANARMIVGVDYSEAMLQQARAPLGGRNPTVVLVRGNLLTVDLKACSFDRSPALVSSAHRARSRTRYSADSRDS